MNRSPPISSVLRISQARMLECVAISFSQGFFWPRDRIDDSCTGRQILYHWATREVQFDVVCLVAQSCLTLCNPMDSSPPGSPVHGDSPGKTTEVGCHALLQGIFLTQGSNPGLLPCRQILYHLRHQGSPIWCGWGSKCTQLKYSISHSSLHLDVAMWHSSGQWNVNRSL